MTAQPHPDDLTQLRAQLAAQQTQIAALQADRRLTSRRRRFPRRLLPLLVVALLPLSLLAATPFNDLTGGVHDANIDAIYNAGITTGCVPNASYCPTDNVTRQEMASFLSRTAGLGTNPPVANAKTAQTATNAGHATSADNATNAQNATNAANANTVGNYAPGDLVRVARGSGFTAGMTTDLPTANEQYLVLAQVDITPPGPGLVLVTGSVTTVASASGTGTTYAATRLRDKSPGGALSPQARTAVGTGAGAAINMPATATWVFPVAAGGPRTFVVETARIGGSGGRVFYGMITAIYVPFGSGGGTTLDTAP